MEKIKQQQIKWFHFLFAVLAGMFLSNTLPHFINGISGNAFPTPFANPPGIGLSSPTINMLWASINFILGTVFFLTGKVIKGNRWIQIIFLVSFFIVAFLLASYFGEVTRN